MDIRLGFIRSHHASYRSSNFKRANWKSTFICQLLGHFPKKMLFDRKDGSSKDGIAICILQNISMFFFFFFD